MELSSDQGFSMTDIEHRDLSELLPILEDSTLQPKLTELSEYSLDGYGERKVLARFRFDEVAH